MIEEQKEFLAGIISTKRRGEEGRGGAMRGFSRIIVKNETRACRIYVDLTRLTSAAPRSCVAWRFLEESGRARGVLCIVLGTYLGT